MFLARLSRTSRKTPVPCKNNITSEIRFSLSIWGLFEADFFAYCFANLRWEFIKENKKVRKQENTLRSRKRSRKKKRRKKIHALDQEKKKKLSLLFLIVFLVEKVFSFFFSYFLVFFYKFSPQALL